MNECFVCASDHQPLYKICACHSVVHEECYKRLVDIPSHSTHCAVCKTRYNITTEWKTKRKFDCNAICVFMVTSALFSFTACVLILVFVTDISDSSLEIEITFKAFIAVAAVAFLSLAVWFARLYKSRTDRWCCMWTQLEPIHRTIHLPAPEVSLHIVQCI